MKDKAEELFQAAFSTPRTPRSDEYKGGVRAALRYHAHGEKIQCPHTPGTAQADAWFSGIGEGHSLWRESEGKNTGEYCTDPDCPWNQDKLYRGRHTHGKDK